MALHGRSLNRAKKIHTGITRQKRGETKGISRSVIKEGGEVGSQGSSTPGLGLGMEIPTAFSFLGASAPKKLSDEESGTIFNARAREPMTLGET